MDKEKFDELWELVKRVGNIDRVSDDGMMVLGSVFGEMKSEIEKLQKEKEGWGKVPNSWYYS